MFTSMSIDVFLNHKLKEKFTLDFICSKVQHMPLNLMTSLKDMC